jgi:hypothetical protein
MGYTHYWDRPAVIDQGLFDAIRGDFERLILPLADAGVALAGGLGEGPPEITDQVIRFNGLDECGHPKNEELVIPYPSESAEGIGPSSTALDEGSDGLITRVKHRCCNGRCSYETLSLPRSLDMTWQRDADEQGLYIDYVKTGFRPYDVAVTSILIIAKRYLKDRFTIQSNGGDHQWADARRICQRVLGYGDWFGIVEEQIVEEWPGNPPKERDVLLRTLVELNPATLA